MQYMILSQNTKKVLKHIKKIRKKHFSKYIEKTPKESCSILLIHQKDIKRSVSWLLGSKNNTFLDPRSPFDAGLNEQKTISRYCPFKEIDIGHLCLCE